MSEQGESVKVAMRVGEALLMILDNLKCAVCLETLRDPVSTRCGHTFCQLCINKVLRDRTATCPLCNSSVNRRGVLKNDKIRNCVLAAHTLISSAKKDFEKLNLENVFLMLKERRPSTRESFSPSKNEVISTTVGTHSRKLKTVATWLEQMGPSSPTQASNSVLEEVNTPNGDDSDLEMISVSQVNPDQQFPASSKPLSARIEEDGDTEHCRNRVISLKTKSSCKSLSSKKSSLLKTKPKPLHDFINSVKKPCKPASTITLKFNEKTVSDVEEASCILQTEKENTNYPHQSRSPGWSRIKKMKKDFQQTPSSLKTVNSKCNRSPLPNIEDSGSGEEEPCLNLSQNSPVLEKKARVDKIITDLESQIKHFERTALPAAKRMKETGRLEDPHEKRSQTYLSSKDCQIASQRPRVPFLKLGSVVSRKFPTVPIYLKGSLEHSHCTDVFSFSYRLLSDKQTQTDTVETIFASTGLQTGSSKKSLDNTLSLNTHFRNLGNRNCNGTNVGSVDMMDAETVVLSSPLPSARSAPSLPVMDTEEVDCTDKQNTSKSPLSTYCQDDSRVDAVPEDSKQSQLLTPLIVSVDAERGSKRKTDFENSSVTPLVDLDDSCSSVINPKRSRRANTLGSSSDSDSDDGMLKKKSKEWKLKRKQVLSDYEDSCSNDLNITAGDTMQILANIEAQLEGTGRTQSLDLELCKKSAEPSGLLQVSALVEPLNAHFDTSVNQVDSDGDSEYINPTPQEQPSFTTKSPTQSDDIVPSSQPPVQRPIPSTSLLRNSVKESDKNYKGEFLEGVLSSTDCAIKRDLGNKSHSDASVKMDRGFKRISSLSKPLATSTAPKPQFVCSSISQKQAVEIEKLAQMLGGDFSPKFTEDTTHLIVRVDENNRADKTYKYLRAVAAGKWVVSFAWVQTCLNEMKLIPEEPFEALDAGGEPGPRRSREAHLSHKKLFGGFEFCCIGDFQDLSKVQLEELLVQCGAVIISSPTNFSFHENVIPLTIAQWDDSKEEEYNLWLDTHSTPLIQHDWVLDCIGKFRVTSFSPMLMCDATDDILLSMGFPPYLFEYVDSEQ